MKLVASFLLLIFSISIPFVSSLNDDLGLRPPMGWMSWAKYTCNIDCKTYPGECIDENLFRTMIDHIVNDGYLKAGYQYVNIDDCWMAKERDLKTGRLMEDPKRFPSGLKNLSDYAHSRGVLLGIYEDAGFKTCMGYPGTFTKLSNEAIIDNIRLDVQTFSDWGIDSLKLDGCYEALPYAEAYPEYSRALKKAERPILYACSWPAYLDKPINESTWKQIRENCHYWRNYDDIEFSWNSVLQIIQYYGQNSHIFSKFHGPGGWFDPDMLLIGNNGLSYEQSKAQMAMWSMWSAPLLMSNDLRNIAPEYKEILLNQELIAIDQDPLGIMAKQVNLTRHHSVWAKKLSKSNSFNNPYAIAYLTNSTLGVDEYISYKLINIVPELNTTVSYKVFDLYRKQNDSYLETLKPTQELKLRVPTGGGVRIVKLIPNE